MAISEKREAGTGASRRHPGAGAWGGHPLLEALQIAGNLPGGSAGRQSRVGVAAGRCRLGEVRWRCPCVRVEHRNGSDLACQCQGGRSPYVCSATAERLAIVSLQALPRASARSCMVEGGIRSAGASVGRQAGQKWGLGGFAIAFLIACILGGHHTAFCCVQLPCPHSARRRPSELVKMPIGLIPAHTSPSHQVKRPRSGAGPSSLDGSPLKRPVQDLEGEAAQQVCASAGWREPAAAALHGAHSALTCTCLPLHGVPLALACRTLS